ncbi:hypothetical protein C8R44DRAFT_302458 [Mycena epipterygia]|nr:hypothetical protein C8R44DRAFT_302458 [Mycena epipterygia]
MVRDPHEAIVRNVLLYPADGGEPHITPMTFNEEGAKANPYSLYTISVDLRRLYGQRNMYATRSQPFNVENQPDKNTEGEYSLFHNIGPKLPINASMARLVGVDPKRPGERPLWRGDVVLVKMKEWPSPLVPGGGTHMDYVDTPPAALDLFSIIIPKWYKTDQWRDFLQEEEQFNDGFLRSHQTWPLYQTMYPVLSNVQSGFDKKKYEKTARTIDRLKATATKQIKRQDLDKILVCGHCKVDAQELRVCGGCRNEKYCSTECQRLAWKEHKTSCKATQKAGS